MKKYNETLRAFGHIGILEEQLKELLAHHIAEYFDDIDLESCHLMKIEIAPGRNAHLEICYPLKEDMRLTPCI